jgi:DNA-binding LytR/AlgR family response regulator
MVIPPNKSNAMIATALIADDEPFMRASLRDHLHQFWPNLQIVAEAEDGPSALEKVESHKPSFAFLDIHMPGLTGLQVARSMTMPTHVVFVTAYDSHALEAFEANAVDYILKPVEPERLAKVVEKLKRLTAGGIAPEIDALRSALQKLGVPSPGSARLLDGFAPKKLDWLQVAVGNQIRMINVQDVRYFESDSKYTRVVADGCDGLIRTSLKDLTAQIASEEFIQTHRSTLVNKRFIHTVHRRGELVEIEMKGDKTRLKVSTAHHQLFRAM